MASDAYSEEDIALAMTISASIQSSAESNSDNNNQVNTPATMASDTYSEEDMALAMVNSVYIQSAAESVQNHATSNIIAEAGTSLVNPSPTQASTGSSQTNEYILPMNQNLDNHNQVDTLSAMTSDTYSEEDIALPVDISASIQSAEESIPPYDTINIITEAGTPSVDPGPTQARIDGSQTNEIRLPMNPNSDNNNQVDTPSTMTSVAYSEEDIALAMAISASIQSANESVHPYATSNIIAEAGTSLVNPSPTQASTGNSQTNEYILPMNQNRDNDNQVDTPYTMASDTHLEEDIALAMAISASIQSGEDSMSLYDAMNIIAGAGTSHASSLCAVCLDAPIEGACIPCGHMASCMSCLNDIKAKNLGCPLCRASIDQIIRIYVA